LSGSFHKCFRKLWFACIFATLHFTFLQAQNEFELIDYSGNVTLRYFPSENPHGNIISSIALDNGVVWALGRDGLYKFDGTKLSLELDFSTLENQKSPTRIFVDKKGMIWFFYNYHIELKLNKVSLYNPRDKSITDLLDIPELRPMQLQSQNELYYVDLENNIWKKIDDSTFLKYGIEVDTFRINRPERDTRIYQHKLDYYVGSERGLHSYIDGQLFDILPLEGFIISVQPLNKFDFAVTTLNKNHTQTQLSLIKDKKVIEKYVHNLQHADAATEKIMYHEASDNILINYSHNLTILNRKHKTTHKINHLRLMSLYPIIDAYGNIFLPSGSGLLTIAKKPYSFTKANKDTIRSIRCIHVKNDSLLEYGSYTGFVTYNLNSEKTLNINPKHITYGRTEIDENTSIIANRSFGFLELKRTYENESIFLPISKKPKLGTNQIIRIPHYDSLRNQLWLAANKRVFTTSTDYNKIEEVTNDSISNIRAFESFGDDIIFATYRGTYGLNKQNEYFGIGDNQDKPAVSAVRANDDKELFLYVTGKGIQVYDANYQMIAQYGEKIGLESSVIYSIEIDDKGNIWSGTDSGLLYIDRKENKAIYFKEEEGAGQTDFNYQASYKDEFGRLYFGGIKHLIYFNPDSIVNEINNKKEKIRLIDAKVRLRNSNTFTSVYDLTQLTINNEFPEIELIFGSQNPLNTNRNYIDYNINGQEWQPLSQGNLKLKELPFGKNNINIRSRLDHEQKITVDVFSESPVYQRFGFYVLILLLLLALLSFFNFIRNKRLKNLNKYLESEVALRTKEINEKNKALEKSNQSKDKIFSVLAHDIKSPLSSLINITDTVDYLVKEKRLDDLKVLSEEIQTRTNDLKSMIDNLLHWSLQQQDKIYVVENSFSIKGPIESIIKQNKGLITGKHLDIYYKSDLDLIITTDHNAFLSILRNLIHNAIKYSYESGVIDIYAKQENNTTEICIEDYGVGMDEKLIKSIIAGAYVSSLGTKNERGTGIGLTLSLYFATKIGGSIKFIPKEAGGTIVALLL